MTATNINLENKNIESGKGTLRKLVWVAPLAMVLATAANALFYVGMGLVFPSVTEWAGAGLGQIMGANIVYLLIGALALVVVNRLSSRPGRHYLILATVGLILSLWLPVSAGMGFGPPGQESANLVTVITLGLMHLISYAISVPMYIRLAIGK